MPIQKTGEWWIDRRSLEAGFIRSLVQLGQQHVPASVYERRRAGQASVTTAMMSQLVRRCDHGSTDQRSKSILDVVIDTTDKASSKFVAPEERSIAFDQGDMPWAKNGNGSLQEADGLQAIC